MPQVSEELIVLKKTKLAEMDLIVTGLSTAGTQVRAVVKGGRKPGSRRGSHLELFCRSRVLLYQGRSSLYTVTEAELVEAHSGCRGDIEHSAAAAAVTELVEAVSRDSADEPRLFNLTDAVLSAIDTASAPGLSLIAAAGLMKVAAQVGFLPNLDYCLTCGSERATAIDEADRAQAASQHFSFTGGGVVCAECLGAAGLEAKPVDAALLDWVGLLTYSRFSEISKYAHPGLDATAGLLLAFARDWMRAQVTPHNRALDFLIDLG